MDRSWITDGTPFTPQYMKGVSEFMEFVRQRYSADEDILCPCRDCLNVEEKNQSVVEDHIHMNGMSNAYTKWIFHGEDDSDDEGGIGGHDVGQQDDADQRDDFGEHNDLYSLAVGPDHRVLVWSACNVNGGRFHTVDREKHKKTQNSGIRSLADDADGVEHEYYGVLKEVIELQYTANKHGDRSIYFFRCGWFDVDGCRRTGMKDDGYFKSVNVSARRYKEDPFILSSQAKSMFYLDDTLLGNNWRVVQNFNHRNLYDVPEKESGTDGEEMNADAYQEENGSNDYVVHDVGAEANEDEQEKEDEEEQPADVQTNNDDRDDEVSSSSSDEVEQPKIMEANEESEDSDVD